MSGLFSSGFLKLETALVAREKLQTTHASNIANADTPNYRADRRTFDDIFSAEQAKRNRLDQGLFSKSNSTIFNGSGADSADASLRLDGNNVDTQKEMARMAENQLMHELTMRMIKGKISSLANAIKEGR
ncbi:flagellar basal-body rod protein FlgB [Mariprofundus ferrinatatus]|uniref:Flagellar basal body rod protein FlgB n=1 Tax=Mariprofundus ferrinatatus TaxID=1921087 RepID=A0A2K8L724_9PROT|nr:flagellar basal body rod protein FlgB [Mariprofundus ferrinatatus]ATX82922.1 flagellar basal-body rod protein FlgB [Mariprofundus ferrinatatus]